MYPYFLFCHFYKGKQLVLYIYIMTPHLFPLTVWPFVNGVYPLRKKFAPRGANSFLQELTLVEKVNKYKAVG